MPNWGLHRRYHQELIHSVQQVQHLGTARPSTPNAPSTATQPTNAGPKALAGFIEAPIKRPACQNVRIQNESNSQRHNRTKSAALWVDRCRIDRVHEPECPYELVKDCTLHSHTGRNREPQDPMRVVLTN